MKPAWAIDRARLAAGRIRTGWPRLIELLLVAALIVQLVRLVWMALTPLGPMGEWRGKTAVILPPEMRASLFRSFDPFFPAPVSGPATQNVTALALTLHGVRINEGSGLGSAIIAGADGVQGSYAVGDEIQPGVKLKAVAFDHVVIENGGAEETIFLDQSMPVTPVASAGDGPAGDGNAPHPQGGIQLTAAALKAGIGLAPRLANGRVTGVLVTPKGPAFQASGLREGDVVAQINGRPVGSADDLAVLQQALTPGGRISLMVERGADLVPIAIMVQE